MATGEVMCNFPSCPNSQDNKNNGQCMVCQELYHYQCLGIKKTQFVCNVCSNSVKQFRSMETAIASINLLLSTLSTNTQTIVTLQAELQKINDECFKLKTDCHKLSLENATLKEELSKSMDQKKSNDITNNAGINTDRNHTPDHLLVVDSSLRDIDQNKLKSTEMLFVPDGRLSSVLEKLESFHGSSFASVTFHVGSSDMYNIRSEPTKIPEIVDNFKEIISQTKAITDQVNVSGICPRLDDVQELVDPLNTALKVLCDENDVKFVDLKPSFTLGDGRVNDGYIWKHGPQLTRPGVNCVARNLKLHLKENITDVTKDHYLPSGTNRRDRITPITNIKINPDGCRHCNERGHNINTCKHPRPVLCNTCRQRGHKSKHHI